MCGRYALHANPEVISLLFGLAEIPACQPRYNIAPAAQVLSAWLSGDANGRKLLRPCPDAAIHVRRVSRAVNSARRDDPGLIEPEPA